MEGFILINKPSGKTSRDCVNHIQKIVQKALDRKIKIGHTGTLDMRAHGLLIIGIGRLATKEIKHFLELDKKYTATAHLGYLTDSLDLNGDVIQENMAIDMVTQDSLVAAVQVIGSQYWQVPPLYSALKHNGERLSKLARTNAIMPHELELIAQRKQRLIDIYSVTIDDYKKPYFAISAHVSHGTYIRTLVDDIAQKVGTRATTIKLIRTAIGDFRLDEAIELDALTNIDAISAVIMDIAYMMKRAHNHKYKQ